MDAYLDIARRVLRQARRPLPPREILRLGLSARIVPSSLYGKTQHKTLQARLSEDILFHRERSVFFRTKPGYFFLREFLSDPSLPAEFRTPIVARRRRRELAYPNALALDGETTAHLCRRNDVLPDQEVLDLLRSRRYHYAESSRSRSAEDVLVWSFVLVMRDHLVLTYRHGRYREDRDTFLKRRSIGFFSPVVHDDLTLFDQADHGIVSSGVRALSIDLNLPPDLQLANSAELKCFVCARQDHPPSLLGLVTFEAPDWLEPFTRRLAINDLAWQDPTVQINHYEDFDPWSQLILENLDKVLGGRKRGADAVSAR